MVLESAMLTHSAVSTRVAETAMPRTVADVGLSEPTFALSIVDDPHLEKKLLDTSSVVDESLKNYVCSCLEVR